jgi:mono/diheme cytochrome c family protein
MNPNLVRAFTVGAIAFGAATMAHAQQSGPAGQSVDVGKHEYEAHCVACHGSTGKGDGAFAKMLKSGTVVANLTQVSKKNNGVFPFARVYETIDGRVLVTAHGPREMPIWGSEYRTISSGLSPRDMDTVPYNDPENFARAKILALTEYVYRLQEK